MQNTFTSVSESIWILTSFLFFYIFNFSLGMWNELIIKRAFFLQFNFQSKANRKEEDEIKKKVICVVHNLFMQFNFLSFAKTTLIPRFNRPSRTGNKFTVDHTRHILYFNENWW